MKKSKLYHYPETELLHKECVEAGFSPEPQYRADIDSLLFFMSDELSYRKRASSLLNVFISDSTGEITGVEIKGFRRLTENMERFGVERIIHDHPTLGLFLAIANNCPEDGLEWIDTELAGLERYRDADIPSRLFEIKC